MATIEEVLADPELPAAIRKLNDVLRVHLDALPGDQVFAKFQQLFHDVNTTVGFIGALISAVVEVTPETLAQTAEDGQKSGQMLFRLLTSVQYVSSARAQTESEAEKVDLAKIAKTCAELLLENPDLLDVLNETKIVTHGDVAAAR